MFRATMLHLLIPLLAVFVLAAAATAQPPMNGPHDHVVYVAEGLRHESASNDWFDTGRLGPVRPDGTRLWDTFETVMGRGWRVSPDAAFGTPRWIVGPGLDAGIAPLDEAAARRHARELATRLAPVFGIESADANLVLAGISKTRNAHGQSIIGVQFQQLHDGLEVWSLNEPRRLRFVYNATLGRLAALGCDWIEGITISSRPTLARSDAFAAARDLVPAFAPGQGRVLDSKLFVLVSRDLNRRARLAWEVTIQTWDTPHLWTVILDANTGDRLFIRDGVCSVDVTGQVSVGSLDGPGGTPPAVPLSVKPARSLFVSIVGGATATTDAQGNFRIPNAGSQGVPLSGGLSGEWCNVINRGGTTTGFSVGATPGTPANIVVNGTHRSEQETAEATAYHWATASHFFVKKRDAGWAGLPRLTTNVNLNNQCNAFFDGTSINFFRTGTQCNNTAIPDVVVHEWGHAFHDTFFGTIRNGGFSEGIGDHLSLYMTDQRILGRGFSRNGGVVRDYRVGGAANRTLWPKTGRPSVHRDGQIWAGTMMDLRDALVARYGAAAGKDLSEALTIAPYARKPADMPSALVGIFLQDDNDANLNNGSPNFAQIAAAADRHALPRPPDPTLVQIAHKTIDDNGDVVNGQVVNATITSPAGAITSARLTYQAGAAAPVTVGMVKGPGDLYTATIPAQQAVTRVTYSIAAQDAALNAAAEPRSGTHGFVVGRPVRALADDFESNTGWTAAKDDNAIRGRFERADPRASFVFGQFPAQPEDDATPGTGTRCYVTQNGSRSQDASQHDVDGGRTSLVSPTFDLSGVPAGQARLSFAYWYTPYAQSTPDPLVVELSSDGGTNWRNMFTVSRPSASWQQEPGVSLPGPYTASMKVRFRVTEVSSFNVTDVLIDDVVVVAYDDNVGVLRATTATPAQGISLDYTLEARREANGAFVFAVSLNPTRTTVPGLGLLRLGFPIATVIPAASLDGSGRASFKLPIPKSPALSGVRVYTQALVTGNVSILSNVWTLTIR